MHCVCACVACVACDAMCVCVAQERPWSSHGVYHDHMAAVHTHVYVPKAKDSSAPLQASLFLSGTVGLQEAIQAAVDEKEQQDWQDATVLPDETAMVTRRLACFPYLHHEGLTRTMWLLALPTRWASIHKPTCCGQLPCLRGWPPHWQSTALARAGFETWSAVSRISSNVGGTSSCTRRDTRTTSCRTSGWWTAAIIVPPRRLCGCECAIPRSRCLCAPSD